MEPAGSVKPTGKKTRIEAMTLPLSEERLHPVRIHRPVNRHRESVPDRLSRRVNGPAPRESNDRNRAIRHPKRPLAEAALAMTARRGDGRTTSEGSGLEGRSCRSLRLAVA